MSETTRALAPDEVAALLRAMGENLQNELRALPPEVARWHPGPGEWCALEALGHLIEAERRGFAGRVRQLLDRDGATFQSWDPAEVARTRRDCERDLPALLVELGQLRRESVALIGRVGPADLGRGGEHPTVGRLTIDGLLQEWVHHDRNHVKQIFTNVQQFVFPHMGNSQRFVTG
jgi:DinB superfamily